MQLEAITEAADSAKAHNGIEARLIATCVRHHGPQEATRVAELVAAHPNKILVGFGLTGDERQFEPLAFEEAFGIARHSGLNLTAHAGKWCDARSIIETVDRLNLFRIGHGIRAVEDLGMLRELATRKIGFEICLSSNVALGASSDFESHPISQILDFGCQVSLATDDPAFFTTTPCNEYRLAAHSCGIGEVALHEINRFALDMAFCDEITKQNLYCHFDDRGTAIE